MSWLLKEKSTPSCISVSILLFGGLFFSSVSWDVCWIINNHKHSGAVLAFLNIRGKHPFLGSEVRVQDKEQPRLFAAATSSHSYREIFYRERSLRPTSFCCFCLWTFFHLYAILLRSLFGPTDVKTESHFKGNFIIFDLGPCCYILWCLNDWWVQSTSTASAGFCSDCYCKCPTTLWKGTLQRRTFLLKSWSLFIFNQK